MTELPDRLLRDALDDTASMTPSATCVDVGTLAAWADGTMTGAERAAIEAHAAACAGCLALLAAMTRTEPPPIAPVWWRRSPIAWLLPLAAVTAGLVIVVRLTLLEQRPATSLPTIAPAAAAPPPMNLPQAGPVPAQPPVTSRASRVPAPARRQKHEPASVEAGERTQIASEAVAKDTAVPAPVAAPAPLGAAQAVPVPAVPTAAAASPVGVPPSAQDLVTSAAGGLMADGRIGGRRDAFAARGAMKTAAQAVAPTPIVIASPDRDSQWRIVGGTVEHSRDGGATWQPQPIGVTTRMRAGAAPGPRVCWLAGARGVVVRTTDGSTWTRIPFPEPADFVAIQASDASHAVVTTADGRRFTTDDGGATWIPRQVL